MSYIIGVISDTHGLLRPEAVNVLKTCDAIIHAGDIGSEDILIKLRTIAPTYAVRGNVDWEPYARDLPGDDVVQLDGKNIYIIHMLDALDLDPHAAGFDAVIFGHSHQPEIFRKKGVLYLNPGSAGYKRFARPVSMAKMLIDNGLEAEIIILLR
jgi:putative phosphoesterase